MVGLMLTYVGHLLVHSLPELPVRPMSNACPVLPFFDFLVFFFTRKDFLVFERFPPLFQGFWGSVGVKVLVYSWWFSLPFSKTARKGRTVWRLNDQLFLQWSFQQPSAGKPNLPLGTLLRVACCCTTLGVHTQSGRDRFPIGRTNPYWKPTDLCMMNSAGSVLRVVYSFFFLVPTECHRQFRTLTPPPPKFAKFAFFRERGNRALVIVL